MNNNNYNPINDIQKKRRLKFGAFAITLTASVIAVVVLINAIFTALCEKNGWFIDMTERDLYTPNPNAMALLEQYRGSEEFTVTFVFCMEEDKLAKDDLCYMVNNAIKRYAEEYDFIKVEHFDLDKNPQMADQYLFNTADSPTPTSVIVTNGKQSIVYSINSFFVSNDATSGSYYGMDADHKIVSAIMRLSGDTPVASFVVGHGETVSKALKMLFEDAGYKVEEVDLSMGEFSAATKVVVINNPKNDFQGKGQLTDEIDKLDKLLDGSAALMVFMDNTVNELPVLEEFLLDWGIRFERQSVVDNSYGLPGNGTIFYAKYVADGNGAKITESLRESSSPQKPVITNCRPITILSDVDGDYVSSNGASRQVSSILVTSSNAVANPLEKGGESDEGIMNVLTLTVEEKSNDSATVLSYVLAGGTTAFTDGAYINGSFYANRDIMYNAMKLFGKSEVPTGITVKLFSDDSLTITAKEANRWTAICTVLFPAIIAGVGIFVYARRRYL